MIINKNKVVNLFDGWIDEYSKSRNTIIKLQYDPDKRIVSGNTTPKNNGHEIILGTSNSSIKDIYSFGWMTDIDFIKLSVTLFHELSHCDQFTTGTSKEIQLSSLSKCNNKDYYYDNWEIMPHEIDAEYNGVMYMWDKLEELWPTKADKLMFEYLQGREYDKEQGRKIYIIKEPKDGYQSKEQVQKLFEQAYERAKEQPKRFDLYALAKNMDDNEIARLLMIDDKLPISEYIPFRNRIQAAHDGSESDLLMASLISYIHPELQEMYKELDFRELDPVKVFGIPIPETVDEVRMRLGYDDSFSKAVEQITDMQDNRRTL